MIAQTSTAGSIGGLVNYLSHGKKENDNWVENREKRVAWETGHNLRGASSIEEAKNRFRRVAARKSRRVEKPYYQVIVSWQSGNEEKSIPPDDPNRDEMEWAVGEVLSELGLEEHQAWIVAHRDTDTPHVHVAVCRIHPRTGETWNPSYDQTTLYHALREIEEEKGWHRPGPMNIEDLSSDKQEGLEYWEEQAEKFGRERSVRRWAREEGIPDFLKGVESWEQAEKILIGTNAELKPRRENGMVIERGGGHAALSAIDPEISRPKLEQRYGQTWETYASDRRDPSDRLSEKFPDYSSYPSEGQLRVYRLVEKIEAIRQAKTSGRGEDQLSTSAELNSQQKEARTQIVKALRDVRDGQRGRGEVIDLQDRLNENSKEQEEILWEAIAPARSKMKGASWASGIDLSKSQRGLLRSVWGADDPSPRKKAGLRARLTRLTDQKATELLEYLTVRERVAFDSYDKQKARSGRELLEQVWSKVDSSPSAKLNGPQSRVLKEVYRLREQMPEDQTPEEQEWTSRGSMGEDTTHISADSQTEEDRAAGFTDGQDDEVQTDKLRYVLADMSETEIEELKTHLEGEKRLQKILEGQRGPAERMAAQRRMAQKSSAIAKEAARRIREHLEAGDRMRAAKVFFEKNAKTQEIKKQAPDGDSIVGLSSYVEIDLSEDALEKLRRGIREVKRIERGAQEAFEALSVRQQEAVRFCETASRRKGDARRAKIEQAADRLVEIADEHRQEVAEVVGEGRQDAFDEALSKARKQKAEEQSGSQSASQTEAPEVGSDQEKSRSRGWSRGRGR